MFQILILLLLISAILSVEFKNLFRAVICLGVVGILLGIIFFYLGANLIGIFQIGIYGGLTIILLFLILMLGEKHE
jgi:NADH:ubiquinone oxidoreductase subunit 6 (subunit J)